MAAILRKYGETATINFTLFEVDGVDFRVDAVHASADTVIMKDEGAEANTTNSFTDEGSGYSLVLTATEMQAARIVIYIIDQTATKVWLDTQIFIETYGNASAQHAFDLDTAFGATDIVTAGAITTLSGAIVNVDLVDTVTLANTVTDVTNQVTADVTSISGDTPAADNLELDYDGTGFAKANSTIGTCTTNTDMRGTDSAFLAVNAPTNFSDLSITVATGLVDITQTAADKAWSTTVRTLTAATNITSDGAAINTTAGVVDTVNLTNTATAVTNRVTANADQIAGNATSATNLSKSAIGIETGAAIAGTLSITQMTTDLTEATDDHFNGRIIVFTSGALLNQATDITDYTGSTKLLTFTALTEAPVIGTTFVIV